MITSTLLLLGCVAAPRPAPPAVAANRPADADHSEARVSGSWRTVGSLLDPKSGVRLQGGAVLGDGRVVTIGGGKNDYQIFDPVTGVVARLPTPWPAEVVLDAAVAPLGDGRLVVVGSGALGAGRWVHTCAVLDPSRALSWREVGCPASWQTGGDPRAVMVDDGAFVYDGNNVPALLDRETLTWTTVGRPPSDTREYSQLVALDGQRVMACGYDGEVGFVLDLHTRGYTRISPPPRPRTGHVMVASGGDAVFVGGGSATSPDDRVDRYDSEADAWIALPSLRHARSNHTALALPDGAIVVIGGWDRDLQRVTVTEILRPGAKRWEDLGDLQVPRTDPVAIELNGRALVLGGSAADGKRTDGSFTLSVEPTADVEIATDR